MIEAIRNPQIIERPVYGIELVKGHLRKRVMADDGAGAIALIVDDETRRGHVMVLPKDAGRVKLDGGEGVADELYGVRVAPWKNRREIQLEMVLGSLFCMLLSQLLQDLQRVGAVPTATTRMVGRAKLLVLFWEVWDTGRISERTLRLGCTVTHVIISSM